jgi:ABC-2 type transport system permease protein
MKYRIVSGIRATIRREWGRILARPVYVFAPLAVMLFCYLFFLTFLRQGLPVDLPLGIIDQDQSYVSRTFARNLDATPQSHVAAFYPDYISARKDMQKGDIYAFILIKHNFERDLLSGRRPQITFYVNDAYLIPGSLLLKDLTYMSAMGSAYLQKRSLEARGISEDRIMPIIQPITMDTHLIANPWANYGIYLLNVLLPGVLQLVIIMMTLFVIGTELKDRTSPRWLSKAGGSMFAALTGKLLPYTLLFTLLGITGNVVLYRYMHFPLNGSLAWMCLATFLYVLAHQAIGVFIIGLFPVLRDGISLGAFYGLLGFTYAGFTFPIEGMPYAVRIFSELFPIRHYFRIYINQALNGADIRYAVISFAAITAFLLLPATVYYRLKKAALNLNYPAK